jgi:hypothetical protein
MFRTLNVTYSQWKSFRTFVSGRTYFIQEDNRYSLILVSNPKEFVVRHDLIRIESSDDLTDFETNIKPTATEKESVDDCVAEELRLGPPVGDDLDAYIGNEIVDVSNGTLTRTGAGTQADPFKIRLNLGNSNTWTGIQTFTEYTVFPSGMWESTGKVGIGVTTPLNKLDVAGSVGIGSNVAALETAPVNGLLVEGDVGIGTTAPTSKLEVAGDFTVTPDAAQNSGIFGAATGNLYGWDTTFDWQLLGSGLTVTRSNNAPVGLSFTSSFGTSQTWVHQVDPSSKRYVSRPGVSEPVIFSMEPGGNVGVGTETPAQRLHVSGNARISNGYLEFGDVGQPGYAALEGNNDGTFLQIGELYSVTRLYGTVALGTDTPSAGYSFHTTGSILSGVDDVTVASIISAGQLDAYGADHYFTYSNGVLGVNNTSNGNDTPVIFLENNVRRWELYNAPTTGLLHVRNRTSSVIMLSFSTTASVFNPDSLDLDFQVKGDTDANTLYVDASTDRVGIGTAAPGNDLEIARARISGTVSQRIINSDNTSGSSHALFNVATGGGSGGDPHIRLNVGATTDWTIGIDNSDSDKLKIGNSQFIGTNSRLTIDISGNIGIGTSTFGTSMVGGVAIKNGTAPTDNVADVFHLYSADIIAGNAVPHFRVEAGDIIKLYKETALTAQLTTITHTEPGTPDYAIQDLTNTSPFGFATQDEGNSVLKVIANLQTRVTELETRLKNHGLLA